MTEAAKKAMEDAKAKAKELTDKLKKEGEAEVKVPTYDFSRGMCIKQELCGTVGVKADLEKVWCGKQCGDKTYEWECSATSLAASIGATAAAIAYTM